MARSIDLEVITLTVPASGYLSAAVATGGKTVVGCIAPTGTGVFTATTASILLHVSADDTTYNILRDKDGTAEYFTVAANNTYGTMWAEPVAHACYSSVKVGLYASDYSTAVTQASNRTIKLILASVTG